LGGFWNIFNPQDTLTKKSVTTGKAGGLKGEPLKAVNSGTA
jgi:hypothetical protein